jgi:hypothetical protein
MENNLPPLNTALGRLKISPLNAAIWKVTFHHSAQPYGEKPFPPQRKPFKLNSALWKATFNSRRMILPHASICIATFLHYTHQPSTIQHILKSTSFSPYHSLIHHSTHTYGKIISPQSTVSCREKTSPIEHRLAENSLFPDELNLSLLTQPQTSSKHLYGE